MCFGCQYLIGLTVGTEHKYEIVKRLQARKHVCGMTGDGVNDAPALKKADIGIAVADATDAARSASDIVLTEPGLSVIISAVLTSRAIFQRMKNYTVSLHSTFIFSKLRSTFYFHEIWSDIWEFHQMAGDICVKAFPSIVPPQSAQKYHLNICIATLLLMPDAEEGVPSYRTGLLRVF